MVQPANPNRLKDGLIIDRIIFHNALLNEIERYSGILKSPSNQDEINLRDNFKTKMNYIVQ